MTCLVLGPGLVGSYLGAAAGATAAVPGPGGRVRAQRVRLPAGERDWRPALIPAAEVRRRPLPLLVATRAHATPWSTLPADALAAQNGLGQPLPVATCFFALDVVDGVLAATGAAPRIVVPSLPARWTPVLNAWRDAGITVEALADPRPAQWEKAILNATVGPLCLATGLGMGQVWDDAGLRRLTLDATREGAAIAAANGIAIDAGIDGRAAAFFAAVGSHRPSVVRDPGELPWVLGHLLRHARRRGLAAPSLARISALVEEARGRAATAQAGSAAG